LEKIVWQNTGGVVVFQVGRLDPSGRPVFDQTEAQLPPGIWGMDKIYGIRFRSRDVASLATIDPVTGYFQDDPDPFNPGNIPGTTSAITGAVNVQHNDALVASQPTLDFKDSAGGTFVWGVINDGANTRVTITPPDHVQSVFGRNGVVTAQSGDYVASQVTNAADKASASQQTFTGDISTGPLSNAIGGGGVGHEGNFIGAGSAHPYVLSIAPTATNLALTAGISTDTLAWRFTMDHNGLMTWGTGAVAGDTSLQRVTSNPPSGTAVGLQSNNPFTVNDPNGFKVVQVTNSSAFSTWLLNTDSQPAFKIFAQGAMLWGAGGATVPDIEIARAVNSPSGTGSFLEVINGDGFGYGTGTGGIVTQATSFSTGVTLSKPSGKITLFTSAISGGLLISFTVTNTVVGIDDHVILTGDNMAGVVMSASVAAGSFVITWYANAALGSATRKINFAVIKGSVA
jgi:hypothetical protein